MADIRTERREYILTLACADRPGIVYGGLRLPFRSSANIVQSQQYEQRRDGRFFNPVLAHRGAADDPGRDGIQAP